MLNSRTTKLILTKACVILLIQQEENSLIAKCGRIFSFNIIGRCYVIANTINRFKGFPHTRIIHIIKHSISIFCRTATLELHVADILTTGNIAT